MKTNSTTRTKERKAFYCVIILAVIILLVLFSTVDTANAGTKDSVRYKYYTSIEIENGGSLWDIAEEYSSVEYESLEAYIDEVKEINHMDSDLVYAGSYLCIPYYSSELK